MEHIFIIRISVDGLLGVSSFWPLWIEQQWTWVSKYLCNSMKYSLSMFKRAGTVWRLITWGLKVWHTHFLSACLVKWYWYLNYHCQDCKHLSNTQPYCLRSTAKPGSVGAYRVLLRRVYDVVKKFKMETWDCTLMACRLYWDHGLVLFGLYQGESSQCLKKRRGGQVREPRKETKRQLIR